MLPRSGVIGIGSFRCSRTSLATRSNSRRLAVVSRRARHRGMTRSSSGLQIRGVASRPRTCPVSLTDSGKPPGQGVRAPGSDFPSPKASSRLTGDASGSRAQRGVGVLSSSRFPESLQRRIDVPIAVDLIVQPEHAPQPSPRDEEGGGDGQRHRAEPAGRRCPEPPASDDEGDGQLEQRVGEDAGHERDGRRRTRIDPAVLRASDSVSASRSVRPTTADVATTACEPQRACTTRMTNSTTWKSAVICSAARRLQRRIRDAAAGAIRRVRAPRGHDGDGADDERRRPRSGARAPRAPGSGRRTRPARARA